MTYVYALKDPNTDEVRHIGKADNPKARHIGKADNPKARLSHRMSLSVADVNRHKKSW